MLQDIIIAQLIDREEGYSTLWGFFEEKKRQNRKYTWEGRY